MEKVVHSLTELGHEAARFINELTPQAGGAALVTLTGELGAGKTAFTKAVAKALGVDETVTSPTFVLLKIYELPTSAQFKRLIHIDAYRLHDGAELTPLRFNDFMQDKDNLIFLEWPEKVEGSLPTPTKRITLTPGADEARTITYG